MEGVLVTGTASDRFQMTPRQKLLFPVLILGSFFDGYDFMIINIVLPYITRTFGIDLKAASFALTMAALGTLVAFFVVRVADVIGRRPVFLGSVILYSMFSLVTAFSPSIYFLAIAQFFCRVFVIGATAVGYVIVSEEFSDHNRGRAFGFYQCAAAIGGIFSAAILPLAVKLGYDWRMLFAFGALPVVVVVFLGKNLPETESFLRVKAGKEISTAKPGFFDVWKQPYTKTMILICCMWFLIYLTYTSVMNFYSYHLVNDLGWKPNLLSMTLIITNTLGFLGYFTCGKLLDTIGRKRTAAIFFTGSCIGAICMFQTTQYVHVLSAGIFGTFCLGTLPLLGFVFNNELFPTHVRANANAWGNNIAGRCSQILVPAAASSLALSLGGIKNGVSVLACSILACCFLLLLLPDTGAGEARNTDKKENVS